MRNVDRFFLVLLAAIIVLTNVLTVIMVNGLFDWERWFTFGLKVFVFAIFFFIVWFVGASINFKRKG